MAYDEGLAERIREVLSERSDVSEKQMFGGIAFMLRGHLCVGIVKDDLMVRVGPDAHETLVRRPHARQMDFTGRPMKGFLFVSAEGVESDAALREWAGHGVAHATSLPAKTSRPAMARPNKRKPAVKHPKAKRRRPAR